MANIYPTTTTTVSPFSEYNSNVVNRLTRMVSLGENCIKGIHSCEVELDSTSTTNLTISTGTFFKDDCLHSIDSEFEVDMSDEDFYANTSTGYWNEAGYYLIVADYTYVKSKPAPAVAIQIIMPSQYVLLTTRYLFLKAVLVQFNGASFETVSVHDYVPTTPTIKREYVKSYIDAEITLPATYNSDEDEGRIIYTRDTEEIYVGQANEWVKINSDLKIWMDTNACTEGDLGYIKNDGKVYPAIATAENTQSCCVVLKVGDVTDNTGQVLLYGLVEDVSAETGITITMGDLCYLSASEAGKITNVAPLSYTNYVGRAVTTSTPGGTLTLWYQHELGGMGSSGGGGATSKNITQATHGFSIGNVLRYDSGTSSYVKAQSDSESNSNVVGIVSNSISTNAFTLLTHGYISGLSGLTPESVYYLSDSVAGLLTLTEPTTITSYSKPLLIATTTTTGYFFNFRGLSVGQSTIPIPIEVGGTNSITGDPLVPTGGTTGQVLTKTSNTNYDTTWSTINQVDTTNIITIQVLNLGTQTSYTSIDLSSVIPAEATKVYGYVWVHNAGNNAMPDGYISALDDSTGELRIVNNHHGVDYAATISVPFQLKLETSQTMYYKSTTNNAVSIFISGFDS